MATALRGHANHASPCRGATPRGLDAVARRPRVAGPMVAPSGHSLAASVPLALPELAFCALCRRSLHDAPGRGDSRHEATTARRIPMPCTPPDGARGFIAPLGSFALPRGNDPRPCGAFALIQFLSIGHPEQLHGACLSGGSVIRWVTIPPPVRVPIGRPPGSRSRRRVDHVEGAAEARLLCCRRSSRCACAPPTRAPTGSARTPPFPLPPSQVVPVFTRPERRTGRGRRRHALLRCVSRRRLRAAAGRQAFRRRRGRGGLACSTRGDRRGLPSSARRPLGRHRLSRGRFGSAGLRGLLSLPSAADRASARPRLPPT
jgi:hypothetical protein